MRAVRQRKKSATLLDGNPYKIIIHRIPSHREGRIAIVTDAGWDAVDAAAFGAEFLVRAGTQKGP
jgi:hypothetical protein